MIDRSHVFAFVSVAAAAIGFANGAAAQYTGPGRAETRASVADVLMKPAKGQDVTMEGRIAKRLGPGEYIFNDGTGSIRVAIDAALLGDKNFNETSLLRIRGKIAEDFRSVPYVYVAQLEVIVR